MRINNFHVVPNGCNVNVFPTVNVDIRREYGIPQDAFVYACVGNICIRKNQIQALRAFKLLPKNEQDRIFILFCGGNESELKSIITKTGFERHLIICGDVPKDQIFDYYNAANSTLLLSESEGFGLSIIEGFAHGLPCLTFDDLPAIIDIYNEQAMCTMPDRKDETVSLYIEKVSHNKWNSKEIKNYANNFSLEHMADEYLKVYNRVI